MRRANESTISLTEVQGLSFVCSTSEVCYPYALWNTQNIGAVPPYSSGSDTGTVIFDAAERAKAVLSLSPILSSAAWGSRGLAHVAVHIHACLLESR